MRWLRRKIVGQSMGSDPIFNHRDTPRSLLMVTITNRRLLSYYFALWCMETWLFGACFGELLGRIYPMCWSLCDAMKKCLEVLVWYLALLSILTHLVVSMCLILGGMLYTPAGDPCPNLSLSCEGMHNVNNWLQWLRSKGHLTHISTFYIHCLHTHQTRTIPSFYPLSICLPIIFQTHFSHFLHHSLLINSFTFLSMGRQPARMATSMRTWPVSACSQPWHLQYLVVSTHYDESSGSVIPK